MGDTQGNKQNNNQKPDWPQIIRAARRALGESQTQFGARFNVKRAAVCMWETGQREAPYEVTWWLHERDVQLLSIHLEKAE